MKPRTADLACAGKDEPAYLLTICTTFRKVSIISFLTADNTEGEGAATACDEDGLDEVAKETKKFLNMDICWSIWLTAYCSQLRQYFKHFILSSLMTAAVVPAAEPAPTTSCCHRLRG